MIYNWNKNGKRLLSKVSYIECNWIVGVVGNFMHGWFGVLLSKADNSNCLVYSWTIKIMTTLRFAYHHTQRLWHEDFFPNFPEKHYNFVGLRVQSQLVGVYVPWCNVYRHVVIKHTVTVINPLWGYTITLRPDRQTFFIFINWTYF